MNEDGRNIPRPVDTLVLKVTFLWDILKKILK